jgi:AcrR family transcriptional regulator
VHHFPTKVELTSAALEYSMEERIGEYWAMLERIPAGPERLEASVDLLWKTFDSKHGETWIELAAAARQDDGLRPLYDGLILHRMMGYDDAPGRADEVVETMKLLATMAFPVVYPDDSDTLG